MKLKLEVPSSHHSSDRSHRRVQRYLCLYYEQMTAGGGGLQRDDRKAMRRRERWWRAKRVEKDCRDYPRVKKERLREMNTFDVEMGSCQHCRPVSSGSHD